MLYTCNLKFQVIWKGMEGKISLPQTPDLWFPPGATSVFNFFISFMESYSTSQDRLGCAVVTNLTQHLNGQTQQSVSCLHQSTCLHCLTSCLCHLSLQLPGKRGLIDYTGACLSSLVSHWPELITWSTKLERTIFCVLRKQKGTS